MINNYDLVYVHRGRQSQTVNTYHHDTENKKSCWSLQRTTRP